MLPPYRYSRACVEKPSGECRGSLRELRATPVGETPHPECPSKSDTPWTGVTILLSYRHENSIYGKRDTRDRRPRNRSERNDPALQSCRGSFGSILYIKLLQNMADVQL